MCRVETSSSSHQIVTVMLTKMRGSLFFWRVFCRERNLENTLNHFEIKYSILLQFILSFVYLNP